MKSSRPRPPGYASRSVRPSQRRRVRERGDELRLLAAEHRRERGGQGLERAAAGPQRDGGPLAALVQGARGHPGQHAGAAQRGLARARVPGDEDQGPVAEALEHGADVGVAPEEERPVLGLEGRQSPVGIAGHQGRGALSRSQALQGFAERLGRGEALERVGREAPRDDARRSPDRSPARAGERHGALVRRGAPRRHLARCTARGARGPARRCHFAGSPERRPAARAPCRRGVPATMRVLGGEWPLLARSARPGRSRAASPRPPR